MRFCEFFKDLYLLFYYQYNWGKYIKITGRYVENDKELALTLLKVANEFEKRYRIYNEKMNQHKAWKGK